MPHMLHILSLISSDSSTPRPRTFRLSAACCGDAGGHPQSRSIPAGLVLGLRQFGSVKPEGHAQAFWEISSFLVLRESGKPGLCLSSGNEPASCAHGCWGCRGSTDSEARGESQGRESIREEELELGDQKCPFSVRPGAGLCLFPAAQGALTGLLSLGPSPVPQVCGERRPLGHSKAQ